MVQQGRFGCYTSSLSKSPARRRGMAAVERLLLLRHARAGTKIPDPVQDFGRGLDADGEAIAARLPAAVVHYLVPSEILSSPYRRCVDTVRPLAKTLGLTIVEDARLAGRCSGPELRVILQQLPANAVVSRTAKSSRKSSTIPLAVRRAPSGSSSGGLVASSSPRSTSTRRRAPEMTGASELSRNRPSVRRTI